jgi:two-component system sensor histidine kinase CpxA
MFGMILFLNWSVQTEPVVSRWQTSIRNQTMIYSETAAQIYNDVGDDALIEFIDRIKTTTTITEVDLIARDGKVLVGDAAAVKGYGDVIEKTFASDAVELTFGKNYALSSNTIALRDGSEYVMIIRWERPNVTPMFGESWMRMIRYGVLLFAALLVCYALAWYLSSPIEKMRTATKKIAAGDLSTRVAKDVGKRHDELSDLANDFDVMTERIESLINSQQRLSRDVSHELRSPLARLNVALEIAKQRSPGDVSQLLNRIEKESHRLNEMIARLLTLAQLESGSGEYERHELNLAAITEQVAVDADFEAKAHGRSVNIAEIMPAKMTGNEALVRSAIENVIRNAVKYTAEGTAVTVRQETAGGKVRIVIEDHGGGVPEEELAKLFTPFYRIGEARERKTGGTGLGLAIAEQAVKLHKGTISARNTETGLSVEIGFPTDA